MGDRLGIPGAVDFFRHWAHVYSYTHAYAGNKDFITVQPLCLCIDIVLFFLLTGQGLMGSACLVGREWEGHVFGYITSTTALSGTGDVYWGMCIGMWIG